MGRSRVGGDVAGMGKSHIGGDARRSAVRRRAVGGSVAGMRKSRVEDDARRSTTRRRGVGGGVVEEERWLHRKNSHGGEERGDGGRLGVGRRLGLRRRRSGSDRMCLDGYHVRELITLGPFHCICINIRITILIINDISQY
jgi:hypothetical protein